MHRLLQFGLLAAFAILLAVVACSSDDSTPVEPPAPSGPTWPSSWAQGMAVGEITTFAGNGIIGWDGDGNTLENSSFYQPIDVEFTPTRGVLFVDWQNHRIRQYQNNGTLETVLGMNIIGDGPTGPDIGKDLDGNWWPADQSALNHPTRVQEMTDGSILVTAWHNHKMRVLDLDNNRQRVIIGRGAGCDGDGQTVADVRLNQHNHGIQGPDGAVYILDQRNQVIRRVDLQANTCQTVGGTLVPGCDTLLAPGDYAGDNGAPAGAKFNFPSGPNPPPGGGMCFDVQGRLYISDTLNHRIRRIDFNANVIETVVGNGTPAYTGDGNAPTNASINNPLDIEFGPDGKLYIADTKNNVIRVVDFDLNTIETVAGTGEYPVNANDIGDGGPATEAKLANPRGVAFDPDGNLIIADTYNNRYRGVRLK